jgi:tetratricopeptide (TPR) repeat protein
MIRIGMLVTLALLSLNLSAQSLKTLESTFEECFQRKDYECAEKALKKLVKKEPDGKTVARHYTNLGTVQRRLGKQEEALEAYSKAIQYNQGQILNWTNRATLRGQMGDTEGALADFEAALLIDHKSETVYVNRAAL